jgi:hypothetical protein
LILETPGPGSYLAVSAFGHYISSKIHPDTSILSGKLNFSACSKASRPGGNLPKSKSIIDIK